MKKITIKNLNGVITHGPVEMEDPSAWIAECVANNAWGKPERWVTLDQEDVTDAIETREIEVIPEVPAVNEENGAEITPAIPAVTRTEYKLAATYTIQQIDITAETEARIKIEFGLKAQTFGAELIAMIWSINESKQLTSEQFEQQMQNQTLANIERCLWNGAIVTARMLIALPEVQVYFSAQEIIDVLAKIDEFLQANGVQA
jgi:hypothetical protein